MIPDLAVLRTGVLLSLMFGMRAAIACDLPAGEVATVAAVEDGETFRLRDGRTVRLAGVKAPAPPLGWKGEEPWPFVTEAKDRLAQRLPNGSKVKPAMRGGVSGGPGHIACRTQLM